jgi:hypothetical protein
MVYRLSKAPPNQVEYLRRKCKIPLTFRGKSKNKDEACLFSVADFRNLDG